MIPFFWLILNYIIYLKMLNVKKTNFKKHMTLILLLLLMFLLRYQKKNHCQAQYHETFPLFLILRDLQFQVLH